MDLKAVLLESSIAIIVIFILLYICGIQFYNSFFNYYGVSIYFLIPWERVIGHGIVNSLLVSIFAIFCGVLGFFTSLFLNNATQTATNQTTASPTSFSLKSWPGATLLFPVLLGIFFSAIANWFGEPKFHLGFGPRLYLNLVVMVVWLVAYHYGYLRHRKLLNKGFLTYAGATFCYTTITIMLLIYSSSYYSALKGRHSAFLATEKWRASLIIENENLRKAHADSFFVPVLVAGEDTVFIKFIDQVNPSKNSPRVVLIKTAEIKSITIP